MARLNGADMLATARPLVRDASPQVRREIALMLQDPTTMLPAYLYPRQVEPPAEWLEAMTRPDLRSTTVATAGTSKRSASRRADAKTRSTRE